MKKGLSIYTETGADLENISLNLRKHTQRPSVLGKSNEAGEDGDILGNDMAFAST